METSFSVKSEKISLYNSSLHPKKEKVALEKGTAYQIFRSTLIYVDKSGSIVMRNVRDGTENTFKLHENAILEFTVKKGKLCTACDKTIKVWDLKAEKPFEKPISREIVAINPYQRAFNGAVVFFNFMFDVKSAAAPEIHYMNVVANIINPKKGCTWNGFGKIAEQTCLKNIYIGAFESGTTCVFDSTTGKVNYFDFPRFKRLFETWGFCNDQFITIKKETHDEVTHWKLVGYDIYVSKTNSLFDNFFERETTSTESHAEPLPKWHYSIETQASDLEFQFSKRHFSYSDKSGTFVMWPSENKIERIVHIHKETPIVCNSYVFLATHGSLSLLQGSFYDGNKPDEASLTKIAEYEGTLKNLSVSSGIVFFEDETGLNKVDFRDTL